MQKKKYISLSVFLTVILLSLSVLRPVFTIKADETSTGSTVTIGEGQEMKAEDSAFLNYLPVHNNYKYSWSEQLYLSSELGSLRRIDQISFHVLKADSSKMLRVYLADTELNQFSGVEQVIPVEKAIQVYSGTAPFGSAGWQTISLTTPFYHDPACNLALIVVDPTGSYNGESPRFAAFPGSYAYSIYCMDDEKAVTPGDGVGSAIRRSYRNSVKFAGSSNTEDTVTVTFHQNIPGQSGQTSVQQVKKGSPVNLRTGLFSREGYLFSGWNTKADGSGTFYDDGQAVTLSASLQLYAVWEEDPVRFHFSRDPESQGWVFVDADGDGFNWSYNGPDCNSYDHTTGRLAASSVIYSDSYTFLTNDEQTENLTPDNWAIAPAVTVPADAGEASVFFWARNYEEGWGDEVFAVYAAEASSADLSCKNLQKWTKLSSDMESGNVYFKYSFSLADWRGKTIRVAIRHYHVSGHYRLLVDDFGYRFEEGSVEPPEYTEVPAALPTYTAEGNVKYYRDQYGNVYLLQNNEYVKVSPADVTLPKKLWPFTDVACNPDNWKFKGISYVYERGIMSGIADTDGDGYTTFNPNGNVTRGQFIVTLYLLADKPPVSGNMPFTDVAAGKYYHDAVLWAYNNQVTGGLTATTFGPGTPISRQDMAALLLRFAQYMQLDTGAKEDISGFTDYNRVSKYARDAVSWTYAMGIISGKTKNGVLYLDPRANTTRAECASILQRFMQAYMEEN